MIETVTLKLMRGPEDADPRSTELQAELTKFGISLREAGIHYSQKAMAFDGMMVAGYPLPEFLLAVSAITVATIESVVKLVNIWMKHRPGRGVRFKDGDIYVEIDRVVDLPKLRDFLEAQKKLRHDE